jgi:predicted DNA-binding transcriptional regulator AlpA
MTAAEENRQLLTRKQVAEYIQKTWGVLRTANSLKTLSSIGQGPSFVRLGGRVYYQLSDIQSWMKATASTHKREPRTVDRRMGKRRSRPTGAAL